VANKKLKSNAVRVKMKKFLKMTLKNDKLDIRIRNLHPTDILAVVFELMETAFRGINKDQLDTMEKMKKDINDNLSDIIEEYRKKP
jgi:hypothetical protein